MANINGNGVNDKLTPQQNPTTGQQATSFQAVITSKLTENYQAMKSIVPKHITPERLARICLSAISRNPDLFKCTPESIIGAIMNCATLGLEPNLLGHAYIIPFWNNKTKRMEAQFQVGYKGAIELFRRTGEVAKISAHEVYEKDHFEYVYGSREEIIHQPPKLGEDRGKVIGYYAAFRLKDGTDGFCVMSKDEVIDHMKKFTKSKTKDGVVFGPWKDHFDEMAKKTCILKMAKYMPISIEKQENIALMEGLARDGATFKVQEDKSGISDAFFNCEYEEITEGAEGCPDPADPALSETSSLKNLDVSGDQIAITTA